MYRFVRRVMGIALLAVALSAWLSACTSRVEDDPATDPEMPETGPDGTQPGEARISVSAERGAPGTEVQIHGFGFPANETVAIGFGPPQSEYEVIERVQTDAQGHAAATVSVPSWAELDREYVWVVAGPRNQPRAISRSFTVRADEGSGDDLVQVEGTITDEGVECPALRDDDGTLYTLAGAPDWIETGQRVSVQGTRAEMSFCQQGTTISVDEIRRVQ